MTPDKRRFSRVAIDGEARLSCRSKSWSSRLLDVSLKGALISTPEGWIGAVGDSCRLELLLGSGEVTIGMDGTIAHAEAGHLGFHCEHIGLDSISHLKRLVELNLGDERLLERELGELSAAG